MYPDNNAACSEGGHVPEIFAVEDGIGEGIMDELPALEPEQAASSQSVKSATVVSDFQMDIHRTLAMRALPGAACPESASRPLEGRGPTLRTPLWPAPVWIHPALLERQGGPLETVPSDSGRTRIHVAASGLVRLRLVNVPRASYM